MDSLTSIEICAGAGGQAIGLEQAGFSHVELVEIDSDACKTLRLNRPQWKVIEADLKQYVKGIKRARGFRLDLLAGGVPCPPFSKAGFQLGQKDERNLFDEALELADIFSPNAIMLENVRGLLDESFSAYREQILGRLAKKGYWAEWRLLNAKDFGVPQLRPRAILVAIKKSFANGFSWPEPRKGAPKTVGAELYELMGERGWRGVDAWKEKASDVAPTLVGGSKKHGGPDLGPTRSRLAWAKLGVDGAGLADEPPAANFKDMPRLTNQMASRIQGFPSSWKFFGGKTSNYRQIGNAFPPAVAKAVGERIAQCLKKSLVVGRA
jgi:DNA (cytosine-5)-methyltransferase 1